VRLPTEEEWEFAARGGHTVDPERISSYDYFPMEEGKSAQNYGYCYDGASSAPRGPSPIGAHLPNPAGVHDTLGNVAELTFAAFKMTLGNRLHGSAGGPVSKGGSFRSLCADSTSGSREEFAFFFSGGPAKSSDLGFRTAISSVNLGSPDKLKRLEAEYSSMASSGAGAQAGGVDPARLLDSLAKPDASPEEKKAYDTLRASLAGYTKSVEALRAQAAGAYVLGLLNNVMAIRSNSVGIRSAEENIKEAAANIKNAKAAISTQKADNPARIRLEGNLPQFQESLDSNTQQLAVLNNTYTNLRRHYDGLLHQAGDYPDKLLFKQLTGIKAAAKGGDRFAMELARCAEAVEKSLDHVLRKKGRPEAIKRADLEIRPAGK
jgi:hypothetical protein